MCKSWESEYHVPKGNWLYDKPGVCGTSCLCVDKGADKLSLDKINSIKSICVAQKVKKTNEVVVRCMTPKSHKTMLDDLYRGNPSLLRTKENDDELSRFFGRKMQFSEEKSKKYLNEKRYKLEEKPKKKKNNIFRLLGTHYEFNNSKFFNKSISL